MKTIRYLLVFVVGILMGIAGAKWLTQQRLEGITLGQDITIYKENISAAQEKMTALPSPADVFVIAVSPHSKEMKDYFTPESFLKALPKLVPADVLLPVGGKIFWQSGVIVMKDKTVLFWRTCGDWFVAIDTPTGTTFYAFEKKATRGQSCRWD